MWRFVILFGSLIPKMKKIYFSIFLLQFFFNSNFNLKFCVGLFNKSYTQKVKKSVYGIPIYANFSYKSAPKPVGRIDLSRFERVKIKGRLFHVADRLYSPASWIYFIFPMRSLLGVGF